MDLDPKYIVQYPELDTEPKILLLNSLLKFKFFVKIFLICSFTLCIRRQFFTGPTKNNLLQ